MPQPGIRTGTLTITLTLTLTLTLFQIVELARVLGEMGQPLSPEA